MAYSVQFLIQLSFSYLATVAFAICINVPRRALNFAGWAGAIGWICYWLLNTHGTGRMFANLIGAVAVGVCGIIFARIKNAGDHLQHSWSGATGARSHGLSGCPCPSIGKHGPRNSVGCAGHYGGRCDCCRVHGLSIAE